VADWSAEREEFKAYLDARKYDRKYKVDIGRFLDRYVKKPLCEPEDVVEVFAPLTPSQAHHLNRAVRVFFNYLETVRCFPKDWLDRLRRAVPRDALRGVVDLKIPSEGEVVESLRRVNKALLKHKAVFNLLLDSGLRLIEAVELINGFKAEEGCEIKGFYRFPVKMFRATKQAYFAYFSNFTFNLIRQIYDLDKPLHDWTVSAYLKKLNCVKPKYIRKFVYDQMTSEAIGIPDSVADFIEGRVPKTIGALHYAKLARKADEYYPRWAKYVEGLRQKAGIV
jgi:intergrase/recombinase